MPRSDAVHGGQGPHDLRASGRSRIRKAFQPGQACSAARSLPPPLESCARPEAAPCCRTPELSPRSLESHPRGRARPLSGIRGRPPPLRQPTAGRLPPSSPRFPCIPPAKLSCANPGLRVPFQKGHHRVGPHHSVQLAEVVALSGKCALHEENQHPRSFPTRVGLLRGGPLPDRIAGQRPRQGFRFRLSASRSAPPVPSPERAPAAVVQRPIRAVGGFRGGGGAPRLGRGVVNALCAEVVAGNGCEYQCGHCCGYYPLSRPGSGDGPWPHAAISDASLGRGGEAGKEPGSTPTLGGGPAV